MIFTETEDKEIKLLTKLKETVDKQRQELQQMKRDFSQKSVDCEAVSHLLIFLHLLVCNL